jgi:hypothetical protein
MLTDVLQQVEISTLRLRERLRYQQRELVAWLGVLAVWALAAGSIVSARQATWSLQAEELDLVRALPPAYWGYLVVGALLGMGVIWLTQSDGLTTAAVGGLTFLYSPAFLFGLYPAISHYDSYLHAAPARYLLQEATFPANNYYANQYPGPATLLALVAGIVGMEPVVVGVVVTGVVQLALVFIFMAISRTFLHLRASALIALAVFTLTPAIITNEHFSQWLIAYVAAWALAMLIVVRLRTEDGPSWTEVSACSLIVGSLVVMSHPFLPIIATAFLVGLAAWSWYVSSQGSRSVLWLTITVAVMTASWIMYVATRYFDSGLVFFREFLIATQDVVENMTPVPLSEVPKRACAGALPLTLLKCAAYGAVGVTALSGLLLRKQRKDVASLLWLAGVVGGSVLIGFASEGPWIQRILYLVPPLLVVAAGVSLSAWADRGWFNRIPRFLSSVAFMAGLLLGFFLWHPATLLYSICPIEAAFVVWPQETAGMTYVMGKAQPGDLVGADLQTAIMYTYFNPNYYAFRNRVSMGHNLVGIREVNPLVFSGRWLIRSPRQEMMALQAQGLDPSFWDVVDAEYARITERIYDNGAVAVYQERKSP